MEGHGKDTSIAALLVYIGSDGKPPFVIPSAVEQSRSHEGKCFAPQMIMIDEFRQAIIAPSRIVPMASTVGDIYVPLTIPLLPYSDGAGRHEEIRDQNQLFNILRSLLPNHLWEAVVTADSAAPVNEDLSIGMAKILGSLFSQIDLAPTWDALQDRIAANPQDAVALHDASQILQGLGKTDEALAMLDRALRLRRTYRVVHGSGRGPRLLAFVTAGDFMANTPLDFLLSGSDAILLLHYVDAKTRDLTDVPDHDVAIVAVAESETNVAVLHRLGNLLTDWQRPVLNNRPETIANLTRDGVSAMFAHEPTILSPATWRVSRSDLADVISNMRILPDLIEGATFPVIIRPIGTHAGGGLERLESIEDLAAYLPTQKADAFYMSPFIDYSGPDGRFTKLRIVQIAGRPYASHLAVSDHWIVHYLSAGMAEDASKRAIEAEWMATFDTDFARQYEPAFKALHATVGLDYFGYDCAALPDGRLLLFELDIAMVVHDMDSDEVYPYKKPAMRKLFDGFLAMVETAAKAPPKFKKQV